MDHDHFFNALRVMDRALEHPAEELATFYKDLSGRSLSDIQIERHLRWMSARCYQYLTAGRTHKANRWLGFIQGALWARGFFSINNFRDLNRKEQEDVRSNDGGRGSPQ
jgi:hypothetical protein